MTDVATVKRTRGPNKAVPWSADGLPRTTVRLAADVSDPVMRRRVEQLFAACFQVRRAVQRDARHRVDAYWAAVHERGRDRKAVVNRLGLDRKGLEAAAKAS